jgi:hypothetical protein
MYGKATTNEISMGSILVTTNGPTIAQMTEMRTLKEATLSNVVSLMIVATPKSYQGMIFPIL